MLSAAFRGIGAICDRLGLVKVIKDRACELFKQASCSAIFGKKSNLQAGGPGNLNETFTTAIS